MSHARLLQNQNDAEKYHKVMGMLQDMRMEHGLCKPRERRACSRCNARDDLVKMIGDYQGAPLYPQNN